MKSFNYVVTDPVGIHARPAGILAKQVKDYESKVVIKKGEKSAEAQKLMAIMGLCVKQNDEVTVEIEGADEDKCFADMEAFFKENF